MFCHLAFEGELQLGPPTTRSKREVSSGKKITAKAAVGIDVVNPTNNYFYAEVSKFTITAIVEAFELKVKLPKALMDTGFPDGVLVSFTSALKGKSLLLGSYANSTLCILHSFPIRTMLIRTRV